MSDHDDLETHLRTPAGYVHEPHSWGRLEWYVSGAIGNSTTMTVGKCILDSGQQNGRHYHPNCDEILTVLKGRIVNSWNDEERIMEEGDVIAIPSGVWHSARNLGEEPAELAICFSNADRQTVGLED